MARLKPRVESGRLYFTIIDPALGHRGRVGHFNGKV